MFLMERFNSKDDNFPQIILQMYWNLYQTARHVFLTWWNCFKVCLKIFMVKDNQENIEKEWRDLHEFCYIKAFL